VVEQEQAEPTFGTSQNQIVAAHQVDARSLRLSCAQSVVRESTKFRPQRSVLAQEPDQPLFLYVQEHIDLPAVDVRLNACRGRTREERAVENHEVRRQDHGAAPVPLGNSFVYSAPVTHLLHERIVWSAQ
jgi:hypothetical protein